MKERPILFSAPMVKVILNTQPNVWPAVPIDRNKPYKWQTRRVMKEQAEYKNSVFTNAISGEHMIERIYCADPLRGVQTTIQGKSIKHHYPIGRHLWVRETWTDVTPAFQSHKNEQPSVIAYRADDTVWNVETDQPIYLEPRTNDAGEIVVDRWRPSIFMPRFASRISLEIKRIRVERLQDISEDDAEAEGVSPETDESEDDVLAARFLNGHDNGHYPDGDCVTHYRHLWEKINGKGSWDTNPFVWAVDFMRIR